MSQDISECWRFPTWYLETLQGFGGMGFDIGFGGKGVWRQNDLLLSLGVVVPWNMLDYFVALSDFWRLWCGSFQFFQDDSPRG